MTEPDPLAMAAVVAYCGWDPMAAVQDETVLLDGNGTRLLTLPSLHVTAVSAVVVTQFQTDPLTATIGYGLDVDWKQNGCLIWSGCGVWPVGSRNVAVTYSGGYAVAPHDLVAAVNNLSGRLGNMGHTGARLGSASINYSHVIQSGGLLAVEQMVFDRYRIMKAA